MSETPQPREAIAIVGEVENYSIRGCIVTNTDDNVTFSGRRFSHSSVGDVLQKPTTTTKSLLQQLSFEVWIDILVSDLSYTPAYTITYEFEDERSTITSDRAFKAAVIDSRRRGRPWALFEITPPRPMELPAQPSAPRAGTESLKARRTMIDHTSDIDGGFTNDVRQPRSSSNEGLKRSTSGTPRRKRQKLTHRRPSTPPNGSTRTPTTAPKTLPILLSGRDHHPIHDARAIDGASDSNTLTDNTHDGTQRTEEIAAPEVLFGEGHTEDLADIEDAEAKPETTAEELFAKVPITVTEHLHEPGRWSRCSRLFLHNELKTGPEQRISILGLKTRLFLYQGFGVFVMTEMELFQGGGYNADDMGLGKTIQLLGVISLNRVLEIVHRDVSDARQKKDYTRHLKKGTKDEPQPDDAKCPSGNQYGIECACVDAGPAARMRPQSGANLIVVPAGLVANWLAEINRHLDLQDTTCDWKIRHAYSDDKMNKLAPRLTDKDHELLVPAHNKEKTLFHCMVDQCRLVCVTTKGCYPGHVINTMRYLYFPPPATSTSRQKPPVLAKRKLAWGRVAADECHTEVSPNAGTIYLFRSFGTTVKKWFLSGTPFERSPAQMEGWVSLISDSSWTSPEPSPAWPEKTEHRLNLKYCTPSALKALGKTHKRIVDGTEKTPAVISRHISMLTRVLRTLWIKRSASRSKFFNDTLTPSVPNTHYDVDCQLPEKFKELVNSPVMAITDQLKKANEKARHTWMADGQKGSEPQINISSWMMRVRRLRILSTFPVLGLLEDTKNLSLSGVEDRSKEKAWVSLSKKHLYDLEERGSPYERHLREICAEKDCPKIGAINQLIDKQWDQHEKAVFCSMGPTPALILYWYLRKVRKAPVAYIYGGMQKSLVMDIIWMFQEEPETMSRYPGVTPPRYLVSTTRLIGVGYTLHKAKRLVQLDPEWMHRDQEQAKKRINRIGQNKPTSTYTLRCVGSEVERAIYDRQHRRTNLFNMALDPDKFNQEGMQPGIGDDDEADDEDDDDVVQLSHLTFPVEA